MADETVDGGGLVDAEQQAPSGGRNIVICCDGTGNQFKEDNTNIVKLYQVLIRDPQRQVVYYDPGVGTFSRPGLVTPAAKRISKIFGLVGGYGLQQNLEDAYHYLMDQYEDGDRIFMFGFSRGALTVRALAGMIHRCGLLDPGCRNLVPYVSAMYRACGESDWEVVGRFRETFGRSVPIHFLGLFDTVSSLGFIYTRRTLPYTAQNPSVKTVRHAISIDERRAYYRQNRWWPKKAHLAQQDVLEVWFPGVHSDVGGGYPEEESGLAKVSLEWMLAEASASDLLISGPRYRKVVSGVDAQGKNKSGIAVPDPLAVRHISLKGAWWILEALPKNYTLRPGIFSWPPFGKRRNLEPPEGNPIQEVWVHQAAIDRMNEDSELTTKGKRGKPKEGDRSEPVLIMDNTAAYGPSLPDGFKTATTRTVRLEEP